MPHPEPSIATSSPFAPVPQWLGLYAVVDSLTWIERLLHLGVKTLQLRIKNKSSPAINAQICTAIQLAQQYNARLFINDHWQLAIEYGAYGVHLGQEDIQTADLQKIKQSGLRLGLSTHSMEEIQHILPISPSYIALGHIFPTQTKIMPSTPQGLEALRQQVAYLNHLSSGCIPSVAIGGISLNNIDDIVATGVRGVAVVSAITQAPDWQKATRQLLAKCTTPVTL